MYFWIENYSERGLRSTSLHWNYQRSPELQSGLFYITKLELTHGLLRPILKISLTKSQIEGLKNLALAIEINWDFLMWGIFANGLAMVRIPKDMHYSFCWW